MRAPAAELRRWKDDRRGRCRSRRRPTSVGGNSRREHGLPQRSPLLILTANLARLSPGSGDVRMCVAVDLGWSGRRLRRSRSALGSVVVDMPVTGANDVSGYLDHEGRERREPTRCGKHLVCATAKRDGLLEPAPVEENLPGIQHRLSTTAGSLHIACLRGAAAGFALVVIRESVFELV
jgi:hypothetical protein